MSTLSLFRPLLRLSPVAALCLAVSAPVRAAEAWPDLCITTAMVDYLYCAMWAQTRWQESMCEAILFMDMSDCMAKS